MKFTDELYVGKSIADTAAVVGLLKDGKAASGVFCVCDDPKSGPVREHGDRI